MRGFVLSPAAQADLDEIWDYTAERWGQEQAARSPCPPEPRH
ncbi:type II toxin-antitoxin system RelE/ParE family toxin [Amaricoccus sp. W119]